MIYWITFDADTKQFGYSTDEHVPRVNDNYNTLFYPTEELAAKYAKELNDNHYSASYEEDLNTWSIIYGKDCTFVKLDFMR